MTIANKFEIHYFLNNDSHSMDAVVKNSCEAEFLAVAYEIIDFFELDITLNAEVLREGGIRELWEALGKNSSQLTILLLVLTAIFTYCMIPDSELTQLQKENLKLQNEKLKEELSKIEVNKKIVDTHIENANKNQKIVTRRSNFYKTLNANQEVTKVGFSTLDKDQKRVGNEVIVPRTEFIYFIQRSNKLPIEIDENAQIEIVAPVLREGKAKWKGLYNEELISFFMDDRIYKAAVLTKQISFKNGDILTCVLEIHKELNEVGEIVITKYSVQTVLDKIENDLPTETQGGKKYRREKKIQDSQGKLF
ncbi:MAG: hypothetical protein PHX61_02775 [Alphaproteobacteria bacterium]|nr:hypothetical protein [Alphaproteobacteria bacterium]